MDAGDSFDAAGGNEVRAGSFLKVLQAHPRRLRRQQAKE
jgi:hypothetical protein